MSFSSSTDVVVVDDDMSKVNVCMTETARSTMLRTSSDVFDLLSDPCRRRSRNLADTAAQHFDTTSESFRSFSSLSNNDLRSASPTNLDVSSRAFSRSSVRSSAAVYFTSALAAASGCAFSVMAFFLTWTCGSLMAVYFRIRSSVNVSIVVAEQWAAPLCDQFDI